MGLKSEGLKNAVNLFLISFITLYFEILFIRWIPSCIQIIAYFTNIILISAFLGLGIGCLLAELKFDLMRIFPTITFATVTLLMWLSYAPIKANFIAGEHLLGSYQTQGVNFLVVIIAIFCLNALLFIPFGQKLGGCLKYFRPLVAYSINITGGIIGIVAFSYLSYLMLTPFYWFLFGLSVMPWFYISSKKKLLFRGFIMVLTLFVISGINVGSRWSPYYKIDIYPYISNSTHKVLGLFISANNTHHQYAFNLAETSVATLPELKHYKEIYEFPYNFIHPQSVLILGAGSGNDAAAALRMGAKDITAVEIDPLIASLGKNLHEEKPYLSNKVHLSIDDARSFIRKTDKKFDLITFGYLDAHKVLSQFSSVRLDNFIYTKESFRDIKEHLSQNGLVSLTYLVFREWIGSKLYATLKEVFGDNLRVIRTTTYNKDDTAIFLAGNAVKDIKIIDKPDFKFYGGFDDKAQFINDDWPYLYLVKKSIPLHYLIILGFIFLISVFGIFSLKSILLHKFNTHFFFLGAGFMLLETVSITRFALLFGSTWIVNSAVIVSILIMILFANMHVEKIGRINIRLLYLLLIFTIFLNWLIKPEFYLSLNRLLSVLLSSFMLSLPLFFAGIIFAISFKSTKDVSGMFAYNLLGAIAGGLCEYISMMTGFSFLFLVAIGIYCLSYLGLKLNPAQ